MSEIKHTPGPWVASETDDFGDITISTEAGGLAIAAVVNGAFMAMGGKEAEQEANARLIAAAPDLLQSLKSLLAFVRDHSENGEVIPPYTIEHERAIAAIAKAEGRS